MEDKLKVGFRFRPYDEELVGFYLRHKIEGNTHLVDKFISEVDICSFDPPELHLQSKVKSSDPVSYFFSKRENKYASGNQQRRTTPSGKWKITGDPKDVKDRWGTWCDVKGCIGVKRFLGFQYSSNKSTKSDWVMHEFHYTLLPESQRTYVICRLEYKGNPRDLMPVVDQPVQGIFPEVDLANQAHWSIPGLFDMQQSFQANTNNLPELDSANQALWLSSDFNLQQQAPYSAPYGDDSQMTWVAVVEENFDYLVDERPSMEENRSNHRPKGPVTGVVPGYSSDTDIDSMICGDTSSSTDSVGSSSGSWQTLGDEILSLSTIEPSLGRDEQPKDLQGKEKVINLQKCECEWKMAEDSVKKAPSTIMVKQSWIVFEETSQWKSQWDYLGNMIIGILLFIFSTGWIVLVG